MSNVYEIQEHDHEKLYNLRIKQENIFGNMFYSFKPREVPDIHTFIDKKWLHLQEKMCLRNNKNIADDARRVLNFPWLSTEFVGPGRNIPQRSGAGTLSSSCSQEHTCLTTLLLDCLTKFLFFLFALLPSTLLCPSLEI